MSEWPEGIPNPHPHTGWKPGTGVSIYKHEQEQHHRAEAALRAYAQRYKEAHEAALEAMEEQGEELDAIRAEVRALLAVRDAAQKAFVVLRELADADCGCPWVHDEVGDGHHYEHGENCLRADRDDLEEALQGLPEHLKGQA